MLPSLDLSCTVSHVLAMMWIFFEYGQSLSRNPSRAHWIEVKNILKYLRRTNEWVLILGDGDTFRVTGYSDTNYQNDRQFPLSIWLDVYQKWMSSNLEKF